MYNFFTNGKLLKNGNVQNWLRDKESKYTTISFFCKLLSAFRCSYSNSQTKLVKKIEVINFLFSKNGYSNLISKVFTSRIRIRTNYFFLNIFPLWRIKGLSIARNVYSTIKQCIFYLRAKLQLSRSTKSTKNVKNLVSSTVVLVYYSLE